MNIELIPNKYSRDADLRALKKVFDDPDQSLARRRSTYNTFHRILLMEEDAFIRRTRYELIRATESNDHEAAERISLRLKDYEQRHFPPKH